jgi:DNA-binding LytR/AlgR family response regulator
MVNILVAEDEEILRFSLIRKLEKYWPKNIRIYSASSGSQALQILNNLKPDIAFLDIQMGDMTGMEVAIQTSHCSHIVFVTAYDEYAIEAFDTGAIDYLLKPYSDNRLKECIERLNVRLSSIPVDLDSLLEKINSTDSNSLKRLKIQIGNKIWLIDVADIICLKASGRYVKVLTTEREALVRMPLKNLTEQLDPDIFWQIHRSNIINITHLDHVKNVDHEQIHAQMKNMEEPIAVSRSYSHLFRNLSSEI